jgi:ferrous iron transport protein B
VAGFDWRTNIALVGGIAAKEVIVSTLGTAYSLGEVDPEESGSLAERIANDPSWNPARALALMLFVLLYAPCFVAVVAIKQEAGSWGWAGFSVVFNTILAFAVATVVYQIGSL